MDFNFNNLQFSEPLVASNNEETNQDNQGSSANGNSGIISNFGGAHLTDFTKRKNWPLRVLGELKDFLHVVSPSGRFLFCSPSCLEMVGFSPEELVGRQITDFIHIDDIDTFIRDFNMAITQKVFRIFYRFRKKDDKFTILEINGHPYFPEGSVTARCFFLMARPYPSKAASTIDSFLELRMENDRLTKRLHELQRESLEQMNTTDDSSAQRNLSNTINETNYVTGSSESAGPNYNGLNKAVSSNTSLIASSTIESKPKTKKPKRQRGEEETHVCTDCGTVDSPEWRKGPQGPKTLCNACGLRYAKKNKKLMQNASVETDSTAK